MDKLKRKMKKIDRVLQMRRSQLEAERHALAAIRSERVKVQAELEASQTSYLGGVDQLNHMRSGANLRQLDVLERSVDYMKETWSRCYQEIQRLEELERVQIKAVNLANQTLKSVESLGDKYKQEHARELSRTVQNAEDELAAQRRAGPSGRKGAFFDRR